MGFLRKVGRKIKKGVKKLFSSKIGAFIGSIALSMIMGPVISRAFNGIKGAFTGAAQKGTETLVQEGAKKVVEEGAKEVVKEGVKDVAAQGVIDNTVTGVMEKTIQNDALTNDLLLQAQEGLKGQAAEAAKVTVGDITIAKPSTSLGQEIRQSFADFGTGVKEFAGDPLGKTKEYIGDEFIPDVTRSVGTSLALGAIQGEPEQPFISGGVAPQPAMEVAQNAYMSTVQTQIPNLPVTNFQQLNQSLLYGTLSPQYLMGQAQYS